MSELTPKKIAIVVADGLTELIFLDVEYREYSEFFVLDVKYGGEIALRIKISQHAVSFICDGMELSETLWEVAQVAKNRANEVLASLFFYHNERAWEVTQDPSVPGAPRKAEDDWAWEEINRGRDGNDVYQEWLRRIPESRKQNLSDPGDSFKKAMKYRKKREKRE